MQPVKCSSDCGLVEYINYVTMHFQSENELKKSHTVKLCPPIFTVIEMYGQFKQCITHDTRYITLYYIYSCHYHTKTLGRWVSAATVKGLV